MGRVIEHNGDEKARLSAVRRILMSDAVTPDQLDDLVEVAVALTGAAMGAISLVEEDTLRMVCHRGCACPEISRAGSFCHEAIKGGHVVTFSNAAEDPRFSGNPLVTGPHAFVTCVSAPITAVGGHAVGALCVLFQDAVDLTEPVITSLARLAAMAGERIDRALQEETLADFQARVTALRKEESALTARLGGLEARLRQATDDSGFWLWDWNVADDWVEDLGRLHARLGRPGHSAQGGIGAFTALVPEGERADLRRALDGVVAGPGNRFEREIRLENGCGGEKVFLARGAVTARGRDGRAKTFLGTLTDVTALAARPAELQQDLTHARARLKIKSDFLARMSHQLRTPLNGVLGMAQVLLTDQSLSPVQKDYLNVIKDSGRNLLTLVNDILDISLIETGALKVQSDAFDLVDLMGRASAMWRPIAAQKGLDLHLDLSGVLYDRLYGDSERIRQVLMNIVSNAIKFTPSGSVAVRVNQEEVEDGFIDCTFTVEDTGVGITERDQERLFTRFGLVELRSAKSYGGSGLGLAIAKGIVEAMGGEIGVESTPDQGSAFWVTIRMAMVDRDGEPEQDPAPSPARSDDTRLRILVAEDAPDNLAVMRAVLHAIYGQSRVAITAVSTGIEAVGRVIDHEFDLVLMDVRMPGMDGLEATRRIRDLDDPKSAIPIIAITAHAMKGDKEKYIRGGMNDYISKPIDAKLLIEKIEALTGAAWRD
ncbi:MAG: ATP-binding protein [Alphaproteobacteria bacterium]